MIWDTCHIILFQKSVLNPIFEKSFQIIIQKTYSKLVFFLSSFFATEFVDDMYHTHTVSLEFIEHANPRFFLYTVQTKSLLVGNKVFQVSGCVKRDSPSRFSSPYFFHHSNHPGHLTSGLKKFRFWLRFHQVIQILVLKTDSVQYDKAQKF